MAVNKITHGRGVSYQMTIRVQGRLVRRRFPTKKQALDEYARLRNAAQQGTFVAPADAKVTFAGYSATWFAGLAVRPSTLANYESHDRKHLEPAFGAHRLDRITRQQVLAFLNDLRAKGLAPATVRGVYNQLRTMFRSAVHDRVLANLPLLQDQSAEVATEEAGLLDAGTGRRPSGCRNPTGLGSARHRGGNWPSTGRTARLDPGRSRDLERGELTVERQMMTPPKAGSPHLTGDLKTRLSRVS